jgi:nucleotide-binding universal stress UspA family protein
MYEKIVIATDGSPNARMATEVGLTFSTLLSLKPVVVTVMDLVGPFGPFLDTSKIDVAGENLEESEEMRSTFGEMKKESEKILTDTTRLAKKFGVDVEPILLRGTPVAQLIHFAHEHDLLFVGAHGEDAKKRYGMGSVSEKVTRHMPCDVFVVRKRSCKRICIALAGCQHDEVIIKKGLALAKVVGASVSAVHVVSPKEIFAKEEERTLIVEKAKEHGDRIGVKVKPIVAEGSPTHRLISLSASHDLVVMGTLGITSLPDFLLGSTAERVVRHAKSSVLVVRSSGFTK